MSPLPIPPSSCRLTADQAAAFAEDGYLLLRGLLAPARIAAVRSALAAAAEAMLTTLAREGLLDPRTLPSAFEQRFLGAGPHAARFGNSWRGQARCRAIYDLHHDPDLLAVVQDLLGDERIGGHSVYNVRPKLPRQETTTVPWHQDSAYFGPESATQHILTAWVPLVPVTPENGALQVVRGSHRTPLQPHRVEDRAGHFLEIDAHEPDAARIATIAMAPGDCLCFGNLLWHRSLPNHSTGIRWSIDLRYYALGAGRVGGDESPTPWIIRAPGQMPTSYPEWAGWSDAYRS